MLSHVMTEEELLTLLPLSGTSKGNDLYNAVVLYFETENLNLKKNYLYYNRWCTSDDWRSLRLCSKIKK